MRFLLAVCCAAVVGCATPKDPNATYKATEYGTEFSTGLKVPERWQESVQAWHEVPPVLGLPAHFDWREQIPGGLTPIANQGSCGSCWAFSTAATVADAVRTSEKRTIDVAEQWLVSCNKSGYNCGGGWFAFDMFKAPQGAVYEPDFPYSATNATCKAGLPYHEKILAWNYIAPASPYAVPSVDQIKSAIYQYGPVSVAVGVSNAFSSYRSGVFNTCDNTGINHAVNLVGWDDAGGYWIMRNSWGTGWGEQGFMRIQFNCNKIGYAAAYAQYQAGPSPEPCSPQPVANAGPNKTVKKNAMFTVGTPAQPETTYSWVGPGGKEFSKLAQPSLKISSKGNWGLTVIATTKCGTARSSVVITVK